MRKLWLGATVLLLSTVVAFGPAPAGAAGPPAEAGQAIPGQFIITLRDSADARSVADEYRQDGADIDFVYTAALNGFAGRMSDASVTKARSDGRVLRIERDQVVTASASPQTNPTWGLDRIDQRTGLDTKYSYDSTGAGVHAYVIDTGILKGHVDFGDRVSGGFTAIKDGRGTTDCNGHGTHVAGTIGGATWGVAKGVKLVPVRVLDCNGSGTWSGVIAGVDWVTLEKQSKESITTTPWPAVANMSLGGGASTSVDDAVTNSITAGVTYAVAAGNGNRAGIAQDACNYSPARVPAAITIGATNNTDTKASWSNYGSCVDWFAPGVNITSAWYTSNTATNTISGTSMAAPHVAGAAALYLERHGLTAPALLRDALYSFTTKGIVTSSNTANNHLLYTFENVDGGGGGTTDPSPTLTAAFTYSCSKATCTFDGSTSTNTTTWTWRFGDSDDTFTGQKVTHTYTAAGPYTVTLTATATAPDASSDTATKEISCSTKGKNLMCG